MWLFATICARLFRLENNFHIVILIYVHSSFTAILYGLNSMQKPWLYRPVLAVRKNFAIEIIRLFLHIECEWRNEREKKNEIFLAWSFLCALLLIFDLLYLVGLSIPFSQLVMFIPSAILRCSTFWRALQCWWKSWKNFVWSKQKLYFEMKFFVMISSFLSAWK